MLAHVPLEDERVEPAWPSHHLRQCIPRLENAMVMSAGRLLPDSMEKPVKERERD